MHIEINIPRPVLTAMLLGTGVAAVLWYQSGFTVADLIERFQPASAGAVATGETSDTASDADLAAMGGDDTPAAVTVNLQEQNVRRARIQQAFLDRKEEILRYELKVLQEERTRLGAVVSDDVEEQFRTSIRMITALMKDRAKSERFLLESLHALWDAEGRTRELARGGRRSASDVILQWPVEPGEGLSALFHDPDYRKRFGFVHEAIDIPVLQGTAIAAAADGIVSDTVDSGLGFSYVTIKHDGGVATLYGHVSKFLVKKGTRVAAGDIIALSGGRPGSPGAGFSTGPHLHFMVTSDGTAVDPLDYLPQWKAAAAEPAMVTSEEDHANGIYERVQ